MNRKSLIYEDCLEILRTIEKAVQSPNMLHSGYLRSMNKAKAKRACGIFRGAFVVVPVLDFFAGYKPAGSGMSFSISATGFEEYSIGEKVYMDLIMEYANKECDIISIKPGNIPCMGINYVRERFWSIQNYNRQHGRERYDLLANYPAGKMMILDRDTMEGQENEIREKFFGLA